MRYLVPLEERCGEESKVSWHFGRAPYYALVEADTGVRCEIFPSREHEREQCGAPDIARAFDADAVVVKAIGSRAYQALRNAGILVFETRAERLKEVMEEIKTGSLQPYSPAAARCGPTYFGVHQGPYGFPAGLGLYQFPQATVRQREPGGRIRVAVACEGGGGLDDIVSVRFGRCSTFTFVEIEGREIVSVEVKPNPHVMAPHGAGIATAQFIASNGASYAVAGRFGPNAVQALSQLGVTAITVPPGTRVRDIVRYL